jgi:hypothetical protein
MSSSSSSSDNTTKDIIYSVPSKQLDCPKSHSEFKLLVPARLCFSFEMKPGCVVEAGCSFDPDYEDLDDFVIKTDDDSVLEDGDPLKVKLKKLMSMLHIEAALDDTKCLEDDVEEADDDDDDGTRKSYTSLLEAMRAERGSENVYWVVNMYVATELLKD